jgi:single-stranded DNA-binding protein
MNVVAMTGRLASDVAHRQIDGHGAVAEFRFAVDGRSSIFLTVETWGHSAGKAASHLTKGRRIAITGRWAQREYLDRTNGGQKRQIDYVVAHDITYLDPPRRSGDATDTADQLVEIDPEPVDRAAAMTNPRP